MADDNKPSDYLKGCPSLTDGLLKKIGRRRNLEARTERAADKQIDKLKAEIRERREAYNRQHDDVIVPEPPVEC
jgi:hypothetical protein